MGKRKNKGIAIRATSKTQNIDVARLSPLIHLFIGAYNGWSIYETNTPKNIEIIIGLRTKIAAMKTNTIKRSTIALFTTCRSTISNSRNPNL